MWSRKTQQYLAGGDNMPIKPGWSRVQIFTQAWVKALEHVPALGYAATIDIYKLDNANAVLNPKTGKYTGGGKTTLWSGKARVQPRGGAKNTANNAADTTVQNVQFQCSALHLDLKPNMYVAVTECENNPALMGYQYMIDEVIDSSNLIERTFMTHVDVEVRK